MTIKIEQEIIGYAVKNNETQADRNEVSADVMHEEIARPEELKGYTYKIKTPLSDHAMYITINNILLNEGTKHEQEFPFEIFINSKNMEQFQWVLALTRVISAVFRKGGDSTFLVTELKEVFDPTGGYYKKGGKYMPSLIAEMGTVLEFHLKKIGLIKDEALSHAHQNMLKDKLADLNALNTTEADTEEVAAYPAGATLCKKCHTVAMVMMDGCMTCLACGDSKCN